ncbi:hypothetical protein H4P12_01595 [Paracoccus sp. 11-3]|uniref:Uncharacterized protein n=1 Tax=Paracoccus amoyensis TaxID=2760093 RepID=A0A926GBS9_9RHOB|nr:hypothetical protein [Paracoccus amoyensis]MBC9245432.1 hypothetical protein [Paracoccus amoyensis]
MKSIISHLGNRIMRFLAPPLPVHDLLDHPDIRHMTPHQLDDLPMPRFPVDCPGGSSISYALTELPHCGGFQRKTEAHG